MIKDINQLKKERPDLVELFEGMSREQLIEQCYKEAIDAINMEDRVQLFMNECTVNMSKTNYTLGSIQTLINECKERDINNYCHDLISSDYSNEEILNEIKEKAGSL